MTKIGKKEAVALIKSSKGRFFKVKFKEKSGEIRAMNCQYLSKGQNEPLGYLTVNERRVGIRTVNSQEIKELIINKEHYTVG